MTKDLFGNESTIRTIEGDFYGGTILHETADAVRFLTLGASPGDPLRVWLPRSRIAIRPLGDRFFDPDTKRWHQHAELTIPDWLAREKGLRAPAT